MEERLKAQEIASEFYKAFAAANPEGMLHLYDPNITFSDPVFGILKAEQVFAMWRMLVRPGVDIRFSEPKVSGDRVIVAWEARYTYTPTGRKVLNKVKAAMTIKDGKNYRASRHGSLWRWSAQAPGATGYLLGWSPVVKRKIHSMANARLRVFMEKNAGVINFANFISVITGQ
ncbi:MAG: nuclear transport factor 2 family protein [Bacteroidia bacterium]